MDGILKIEDNNKLTSLSDLENLTSVNSNLEISHNDSLVDLTFDGLEIVHGHFTVSRNQDLRSLSLPRLTTINGDLSVAENPKLETLSMPLLIIVKGSSDIFRNNCTNSQGFCIPEWKTTNPLLFESPCCRTVGKSAPVTL